MSVPLRRDESDDEELTTADLAQSKRPVLSEDRPENRSGPVLAERARAERNEGNISDRDVPDRNQMARNDEAVRDDTGVRNAASTKAAPSNAPLFPNNELDGLRSRWNEVQATFVDEPRRAVEEADGLVASAMKRLAEVFADERFKLEQQWDRGDNVSTEDLRIALQKYRSFFQRLLSV